MIVADEIRQCPECFGELHAGEVCGPPRDRALLPLRRGRVRCCVWEDAETTWIAPDRLEALSAATDGPAKDSRA